MTDMAVTIEGWEVVELLTTLADKSLVVYNDAARRYELLETVRQYTRDRLEETDTWRDRHAAHFNAVAEEAEGHLTGADQRQWLERLEAEHDNLRAALDWLDDRGMAVPMAGSLWRFWETRGHLTEGRGRLARALEHDAGEATAERARALSGAGNLAYHQGDYPVARKLHDESLKIRRSLGDLGGAARSLNNLGIIAHEQGEYPVARGYYQQSLAMLRQTEDRRAVAILLSNLGNTSHELGDFETARAMYDEAVTILRELRDGWGLGSALTSLGNLAYDRADYESARAFHEESLEIRKRLGDPWSIAISLFGLGNVAFEQGYLASAKRLHAESLSIQHELGHRRGVAASLEGLAADNSADDAALSARLWGAAERLREEIGAPLTPNQRQHYERHISAARAAVGDDGLFDGHWAAGRAGQLDAAIRSALAVQNVDCESA